MAVSKFSLYFHTVPCIITPLQVKPSPGKPEKGSGQSRIKYSRPEVNRQITKQLINDYGAIVSTLVKVFGYESLEHVQRVCANSFEKMRTRWGKMEFPKIPKAPCGPI